MAKSLPKPRILFVCSQDTDGKVSSESLAVLRQLIQLLQPLEAQGQIELWAEEPDSRVFLEDILSQRTARQYITLLHVLGPVFPEGIRVRARSGDGWVRPDHPMWAREQFPFLRGVFFSGNTPAAWLSALPERGIPMVLATGLSLDTALEPYLLLMSGISVLEAAEQSIHEPDLIFPLKSENAIQPEWPQGRPDEAIRGLTFIEDKARALSWRLRNPLLIPSTEKQWLNQLIQQQQKKHSATGDLLPSTPASAPRIRKGPELISTEQPASNGPKAEPAPPHQEEPVFSAATPEVVAVPLPETFDLDAEPQAVARPAEAEMLPQEILISEAIDPFASEVEPISETIAGSDEPYAPEPEAAATPEDLATEEGPTNDDSQVDGVGELEQPELRDESKEIQLETGQPGAEEPVGEPAKEEEIGLVEERKAVEKPVEGGENLPGPSQMLLAESLEEPGLVETMNAEATSLTPEAVHGDASPAPSEPEPAATEDREHQSPSTELHQLAPLFPDPAAPSPGPEAPRVEESPAVPIRKSAFQQNEEVHQQKATAPEAGKKKPKPAQRPEKRDAKPATPRPDQLETRLPGEKVPTPAQRDVVATIKTKPKPGPNKEARPSRPQSEDPRRRRWMVFGLIAAATLLLASSLLFPGVRASLGFAGNLENPCPFPASEAGYKVLVLSFIPEGDCRPSSLVHEKVLVNQLKALRQDGARVDVRFLQVEECNDRRTVAEGIAGTCGADLVLWATYTGEDLPNATGVLCYHVAEQKFSRLLMQEQAYEEAIRLQPNAIIGDFPQLQAANLIYWFEALHQQAIGHLEEASRYLEMIVPPGPDGEQSKLSFLRSAYLSIGQYSQAKRLYDEVIAAHPDDARAYVDRADIFRRMGLLDMAISDYNRALELQPDGLESLLGRAMVQNEKASFPLALQDYNRVLAVHGELAMAYVRRGDTYAAMASNWNAQNDYNKAIALQPDQAEARVRRAALLVKLGQKAEALADIQEALRLQPNLEDARLFEAEMNLDAGAYDVALSQLNALIEQQPTARAHFDRGRLLLQVRDMPRALGEFSRAVEMDPTYGKAWLERGKAEHLLGRYDEAIGSMKRLLSLRPAESVAYAWTGRSQAALGLTDSALATFEQGKAIDPAQTTISLYLAETLFESGQVEPAMEEVTMLLMRARPSAEALLLRGRIQVERNQLYAALGDMDRAISLEPQLAQAYVARAMLRYRLKDVPRAQQDLEEAIRLKTQDPGAYLLRAEILAGTNQYNDVLELFARAIELDSSRAESFEARGAFLQRFHREEQALADFQRAASLGASSPGLLLRRGQSYAALGKVNEAMIDLNQVVRAWPDSAKAYCARGGLYQQTGQNDQAQQDFQKAVELEPNNPETYCSLGMLFAEMDNPDKAMELFDKAIQLESNYAKAYNYRGEVFAGMEAYPQALGDFSRAIQLDPTLSRAFRNRADLARKAGEYASAIQDYSQAVLYDPSDAASFYFRGFLYAMQQQYDRAVPDIRHSLELDPNDGIRYGFLAKVYARQGKKELFYENIEIALAKQYPIGELKNDPAFKPFQQETRFQGLLERYQR